MIKGSGIKFPYQVRSTEGDAWPVLTFTTLQIEFPPKDASLGAMRNHSIEISRDQ